MEDGFQRLEYLHQSVKPTRDKTNDRDTSLIIKWKRKRILLSYIEAVNKNIYQQG
jgi:hypothetical protein